MARKRYSLFIRDGQLTAARNAIKDSLLDPRGGGLNEFSVECQRVGGGGPKWWGASWVLEDAGLDTVSFELLVRDVVEGLNMLHNTGNNANFASYSEDDFPPGSHPRTQFNLALADVVKKPALEVVPPPEA